VYGGEIELRGKLESAICKPNENSVDQIPIVVLVLEGGFNFEKIIKNFLNKPDFVC